MRSEGFEEASIAGIHGAMRDGSLTCRTLTAWYLERAKEAEDSDRDVRALLTVNPRALEVAERLDAELGTSRSLRPLHGIPVVLKDNIATQGLRTTLGSTVFRDFVPAEDATVVKRLQEAGAIILAKANLHELALGGETVSSLGGQTRNPYDLTRTPGGSSGGSAAAVASNLACVALGTDTVNSVRSPASACCLVGVKPTRGLIGRSGIAFSSFTQDTVGPITRSVDDAIRLLTVLAGYDPGDRATGAFGESPGERGPLGNLTGMRIGVPRSFFGSGEPHRAVNDLMRNAFDTLSDLGAEILDVPLPFDAEELVSSFAVNTFETRRELDRFLSAQGTNAPVTSLEALVATGEVHPSLSEGLATAMRLRPDHPEYAARMLRRLDLQETVLDVMARHRLSALAYPHQKRLVAPIGEPQVERNGILGAVTGFPGVVIPAGFSPSGPTAPLGVPVGLEFLGRPWSEFVLLRMAAVFERATGHRRPPG